MLTDPPYGTTANEWDRAFEIPWGGLNRITKPHAPIVLFSQLPFAVDVIASNRENYRYEWIWHKTNAVGFLDANWKPLRAHENILVFSADKSSTYNPQWWWGKAYTAKVHSLTTNYGKHKRTSTASPDGKRYPIDVLTYPRDQGFHPTQKPVKLLEYLVLTYTNSGETVLDFTMGSGSAGVACANTGRDFIGIEKEHKYFEMAKRRIEEATAQMQIAL